jgi:hypothetical protein
MASCSRIYCVWTCEFGDEMFPRAQQTPEAVAAYQKAEIEKVSAFRRPKTSTIPDSCSAAIRTALDHIVGDGWVNAWPKMFTARSSAFKEIVARPVERRH